jgi:hypothetical protein
VPAAILRRLGLQLVDGDFSDLAVSLPGAGGVEWRCRIAPDLSRYELVLITATCPACQTRYQVQPTLRGKPMRCPNAKCRKVFVVPNGEAERLRRPDGSVSEAHRPVPGKPQRSGAVGDIVPILPAAEIGLTPESPAPVSPAPAKREPDKAAPSWRDAPPPVRKSAAEKTEKAAPRKERGVPAADPEVTEPPQPWYAPPVRGGQDAEADGALTTAAKESTAEKTPPQAQPRRSRSKVYAVVAALLLLVLAGLGGTAFYVWSNKEKQAAERFDEALQAYKKGDLRQAADKFHDLKQGLDDGDRKQQAQFYESLARLRAELEERLPDADKAARTADALAKISSFVNDNRGKKLLLDNSHDVALTFIRVIGNWTEDGVVAANDAPLELVKQAVEVKELLAGLKDGLTDDEAAKIESELDKVRQSVARWQRKEAALASLKKVLTIQNPVAAIKQLVRVVKRDEDAFRGEEQAVAEIKTRLYDAHFASLANMYHAKHQDLERPDGRSAPAPSLAVTPLVREKRVPGGEGVDLVTARGVLYGLERGSGQFRWAMRIGLDGNAEPLRLQPGANGRERFLVLAENATVALVVDDGGALLWRYDLRYPCLGKPLLVDQRAFLPTENGHIHVLDLSRGRLHGYYDVGQRLSVGGVYQRSKRLAYFPADEMCVYVLDVAHDRCAGVLYTGHPAGSLRSEPLIVAPQVVGRANQGGYLILNQTAGVDETLLRVYPLPIGDRLAAPLTLKHEPRLRGWTWFAPYADDEKVALVTDAGRLGLFGVKQAENADPDLFPLLPVDPRYPGGLRLDVLLPPDGSGRGRAQVVHARGEDLWVLAHGKLQRLQIGWHGAEGRALLPVWRTPLDLGLPLHAAHVDEDREANRALLVLATQAAAQPECLATAVEEETGTIRWQRQLGMVCCGTPVPLGGPDDPTPLLLTVDQAGALFQFDPRQFDTARPGLAQGGGVREADPVDGNPLVPPVILPGPDGQSAYEVASLGRTGKVVVRAIVRDSEQRRLKLAPDRVFSLPAPLGGTPAVVGGRLLLPLENGRLMALKVPLDGSEPRRATDWRAGVSGSSARGHIIPLGPDRFLTADGQQGLTHWRWPENEPLPKATRRSDGAWELKAPLAAAPLVLPAGKETPMRVCVVDIEGTVTLLDLRPEGELIPNGMWELKGRVTSAPFLRFAADGTTRIGCVVDERRLVWLDPAHDGKPAWEYTAGGEVASQPQVIEGVLIVALRTGVFFGLDPATGQPKGEKLAAPNGVAPAISPVPFGPGRLFAPLEDGTILLPELSQFGAR